MLPIFDENAECRYENRLELMQHFRECIEVMLCPRCGADYPVPEMPCPNCDKHLFMLDFIRDYEDKFVDGEINAT